MAKITIQAKKRKKESKEALRDITFEDYLQDYPGMFIRYEMYKQPKFEETSLTTEVCIEQFEGETIENKIERILNSKDGIEDGIDKLVTSRADGILPETNVRTDKWELAMEAKDAESKSYRAKREQAQKDGQPENEKNQPGGKTKTDQNNPEKPDAGGSQ